jgi:hypothetical protein
MIVKDPALSVMKNPEDQNRIHGKTPMRERTLKRSQPFQSHIVKDDVYEALKYSMIETL